MKEFIEELERKVKGSRDYRKLSFFCACLRDVLEYREEKALFKLGRQLIEVEKVLVILGKSKELLLL